MSIKFFQDIFYGIRMAGYSTVIVTAGAAGKISSAPPWYSIEFEVSKDTVSFSSVPNKGRSPKIFISHCSYSIKFIFICQEGFKLNRDKSISKIVLKINDFCETRR